jgi:hypothetical protein
MVETILEPPFSELVFGFVYPVGTDADPVVSVFKKFLKQYKYEPHEFRISNVLRSLDLDISFEDSSGYGKADALIRAGDKAREKSEDDSILSVLAITEIASYRRLDEQQRPQADVRKAHLIRSLKRKEEVSLFRDVYRSGFYLIGIGSDDDMQQNYLEHELGMTPKEARDLMERDQNEQPLHGQRTRDTFCLADVFVQANGKEYKEQLERFLELVFGNTFITVKSKLFCRLLFLRVLVLVG